MVNSSISTTGNFRITGRLHPVHHQLIHTHAERNIVVGYTNLSFSEVTQPTKHQIPPSVPAVRLRATQEEKPQQHEHGNDRKKAKITVKHPPCSVYQGKEGSKPPQQSHTGRMADAHSGSKLQMCEAEGQRH